MMALASAERAGIDVPAHTWTRRRFLRSVRRGKYGGLASYRPDGPPSTSMTAEALYCRLLLPKSSGERIDNSGWTKRPSNCWHRCPMQIESTCTTGTTLRWRCTNDQQDERAAAAAGGMWNDALTTVLVSTQQPTDRMPEAGTPTRFGADTAAASTRRRWLPCAWKSITAMRRPAHWPSMATRPRIRETTR